MVSVEDIIQHVSTKPWSDYQESDYTLQQWYDACLIHLKEMPDFTKADGKLPVKTPDGAVNRNGVFAAAAALAGAREPLKAPDTAKKSAAKQLIKMYQSMNAKPPDSLMNMAGMMGHSSLDDFLKHYGLVDIPMSTDQTEQPIDWMDVANSLIVCVANRFNNDPAYSNQDLTKNKTLQQQYDDAVEKAINNRLTSLGILSLNKIDDYAFLYGFDRKNQVLAPKELVVVHQKTISECVTFLVNLDEEGFIVGLKPDIPNPEPAGALNFQQSDFTPDNILNGMSQIIKHHGVRGMHWGVRHEKLHVSDTPWSSFKESDYTRQQWHNASLIHDHIGPPTSKSQCKLPIRQPDGVINRNGVHSAVAALAGARIPVKATSAQKSSAAKKLIDIYHQMGEKPPVSLATITQNKNASHSVEESNPVNEFISHYGVRGMHWGVRRSQGPKFGPSKDAKRSTAALKKAKTSSVKALTNKELRDLTQRMELERKYKQGLPESAVKKGRKHVKRVLGIVGVTSVSSAIAFANSPAGKHIASIFEKKMTKTRNARREAKALEVLSKHFKAPAP